MNVAESPTVFLQSDNECGGITKCSYNLIMNVAESPTVFLQSDNELMQLTKKKKTFRLKFAFISNSEEVKHISEHLPAILGL